MALAYLLDPCQQYQNRAGVNNVNGYFEVFISDTDDHATVYTDFNGTLAPEHIGIDLNGRAVMIVDSAVPYRVEMYEPNGDLVFTQYPVWTQKSGGGVTGTDIVSSDGSIEVQSYNVGSVKTYDLSAHVEDSADLLGWVRTEGYDIIPSNIYKPRYAEGNLYVGEYGVQLDAGQYYHVTAHIKCTKVNTGAFPWVDDVQVHFKGRDRVTGEYVVYKTFKLNVDYSLMLPEEHDLSLDVKAESDIDLVVVIDDKEVVGGGFDLTDMEIHRVYSGYAHLPGGVATKPWVEQSYQEKLTAGAGITIDEDNVISSDGAGYTAGSGIVIDDHEISVDTTAIQEKLTAGTNVDITNNVISATDTTYSAGSGLTLSGTEFSVDTSVVQPKLTAGSNIVIDGNTISATAEPQEQANWAETNTSSVQYIQNKPQNLVQDASYVHTDNNFTTALKDKLDGIASGAEVNVQADWTEADSNADSYIQNKPTNLVQDASYVHTDNNFTTALKDKLDGIASGAEVNVQADWSEADSSADDFIKNKPQNLVQDASYVHTDNNFTTALKDKLDGIASGAEVNVQADWTEANSSVDSFIKNKPTLATVATSGSYTDLSNTPSIPVIGTITL